VLLLGLQSGAALERLSGEPVDADAPASARRASSRRIAQRLAAMTVEEIRAAVFRGASTAAAAPAPAATATSVRVATPVPTQTTSRISPLPQAEPRGEGQGEGAARTPRTAVAVVAAAPTTPPASDLDARIVAEIRAALRGCTPDGLASALSAPQPRVEAALEALAVRGAVARRGTRWFMS